MRREITKGTLVKVVSGPYKGMFGVVTRATGHFYQVEIRPTYSIQARANEMSAMTAIERLALLADD